MDPLYIGLILLVVMGIGIMLGIHVAFILTSSAVLGMWLITGRIEVGMKLLATTAFSAIMDYVFAVVPFFVAMGLISSISGASELLYNAAHTLTGRIRGGLGIATVLANAVFAAITGVSVASAAVFSKVSLPSMKAHGYDKKFALGIVAGSSVLGMLIPPSILFVVYGILADEAIGKLLIAGIIPGLILTGIFSAGITFMVWRRPQLIALPPGQKESQRPGLGEMARAIGSCWGILTIILITMGGIWLGFFTPTEAGAVGAMGTLLLGLSYRQINLSKFWQVLLETGITTSSILILLISAQSFARMLGHSGVINWFSNFVLSLPVPPIAIILLFLFIFLVLGCFIDSTSILLLTMPLMLPVVKQLGYDFIWFGVVSVVTIEVGIITPPFGLVVFAMKAALGDEAEVWDIFRGTLPFEFMMGMLIFLLLLFPKLSTWLPSLM